MESEFVLRILFFLLFILMILIRVYYGVNSRRRGNRSWQAETEAVNREGRWSIFVRGILFLYMLLVVALYVINPDWLSRFAIPLPAWLRWFGGVLSAITIPFLIWVHHTLKEEWSTNLRIKKEHQLVTSGPYQWVRHPMYCVLFTFFFGLTLLSSSWPVLALTAPIDRFPISSNWNRRKDDVGAFR